MYLLISFRYKYSGLVHLSVPRREKKEKGLVADIEQIFSPPVVCCEWPSLVVVCDGPRVELLL